MKRGKKGQFYLIAAIIIVGLIISISSLNNYIIVEKTPVKFYDLSNELELEKSEVIDYGLVKNSEINNLTEDFVNKYVMPYVDSKDQEIEAVFVYGDENNMQAVSYTSNKTGTVTVRAGGNPSTINGLSRKVKKISPISLVGQNRRIYVNISKTSYDFDIKKGRNFFFILTKKTDKETYIAGTNREER